MSDESKTRGATVHVLPGAQGQVRCPRCGASTSQEQLDLREREIALQERELALVERKIEIVRKQQEVIAAMSRPPGDGS